LAIVQRVRRTAGGPARGEKHADAQSWRRVLLLLLLLLLLFIPKR